MKIQIKKMVFLALPVSVGAALGFLESMIPLSLPLPGARSDLSNLVILTNLLVFGSKEGFIAASSKSLFLMLVTGNVMAFFYSTAGSIPSRSVMIGAIRWTIPRISSIGINLTGASFHNLGQVSVTCLVVSNWQTFAYLPMLLLLGIFTGLFMGLGSDFIVDQMKRNNIVFKE